MENPYETPRTESAAPTDQPAERPTSALRGLAVAMLLALAGFAAPVLMSLGTTLMQFPLLLSPEFAAEQLAASARGMRVPAVGCGWVFALAGFLAATPARGRGYVRSLLQVGLVALGGILAAGLLLPAPRVRSVPDSYEAPRFLLAAAIPLAAMLLMLFRDLNNRGRSPDGAEHAE